MDRLENDKVRGYQGSLSISNLDSVIIIPSLLFKKTARIAERDPAN
jgi:hypothetical protein